MDAGAAAFLRGVVHGFVGTEGLRVTTEHTEGAEREVTSVFSVNSVCSVISNAGFAWGNKYRKRVGLGGI
jgi:hypothetical protein